MAKSGEGELLGVLRRAVPKHLRWRFVSIGGDIIKYRFLPGCFWLVLGIVGDELVGRKLSSLPDQLVLLPLSSSIT